MRRKNKAIATLQLRSCPIRNKGFEYASLEELLVMRAIDVGQATRDRRNYATHERERKRRHAAHLAWQTAMMKQYNPDYVKPVEDEPCW